MFWKQKSPKDILLDKYLELIKTNGMEGTYEESSWNRTYDRTVKGKIVGTDIRIYGVISEYTRYFGSGEEAIDRSVRSASIGLVTDERINSIIYTLYDQIEKEEQKRMQIEQERMEEERRIAEDNKYIKEYKRISGLGNEFTTQFKILDEINLLGKRQESLLKEWSNNTKEIYKKRQEFYNL